MPSTTVAALARWWGAGAAPIVVVDERKLMEALSGPSQEDAQEWGTDSRLRGPAPPAWSKSDHGHSERLVVLHDLSQALRGIAAGAAKAATVTASWLRSARAGLGGK